MPASLGLSITPSLDTLPLLMLCLGSLRVSPSQHLELIIMKTTRDLLPIQKLFEWSDSFEKNANPFCLFMDLIGYSEDRYGMNTYDAKYELMGYTELCMLGDALKVFEARGYDEVYQFLDYLQADDLPSLEESILDWNEEYATANAY